MAVTHLNQCRKLKNTMHAINIYERDKNVSCFKKVRNGSCKNIDIFCYQESYQNSSSVQLLKTVKTI